MFNAQRPRLEDLPTSRQLVRATLLAVAAALAILVAIILPAEHGVDPTGIGRVLGLTQMGEIKAQLAEEAEQDAQAETAASIAAQAEAPATAVAPPSTPAPASTAAQRSDTTTLTLAPGEGAEVKVTAGKGAQIGFSWSVAGGRVNYDTHGDAPGIDYHGYGKGKQSAGEQGTLTAAFDGKHGWFWRNRSDAPVTVTLRTQGDYSEVRRLV